MLFHRMRNRLRRIWRGSGLHVWHHPSYRLPMATLGTKPGFEPRRADMVAAYLVNCGLMAEHELRRAYPVAYAALGRVHSHELLESLQERATLGRIFAVEESDVHVVETLRTIRLACGATLEAARATRRDRLPALNLLGGFHHAEPARASSLCPVNDIAVAVAVLRAEGFTGRVVVLDLDAHPPDGTAACFEGDDSVWIGSISGSDWGPLPGGVDETLLAVGSSDRAYGLALADLLERMPSPALAFVIAGGDVLAGDHMGKLGLTLAGARRRDLMVVEALDGCPSVWLPGGGYHPDAWRVLAGTALAIGPGSDEPLPPGFESTRAHFSRIADTLQVDQLTGESDISFEDLLEDLGQVPRRAPRLLGYYSTEGIEYALDRLGIFEHLRRLGYRRLRSEIDCRDECNQLRLYARAGGVEHLLVECVLQRKTIAGDKVLYVHWLTLQDSARRLTDGKQSLPGQEHPGLGLAREVSEVFGLVAKRLGLAGVAFTPSWYHMAYLSRREAQFVDPQRQGRFEALMQLLEGRPMLEASAAVAAKQVLLDGEPYVWEAEDMISWLDERRHERDVVEAEAERVTFTLATDSS